MRWTGHVARIKEMRNSESLKEKYHLEGLRVDGRVILKRIFKNKV
jgi:hypothetical protein